MRCMFETVYKTFHMELGILCFRCVPHLMTLHHRLLSIGVNVENMSQPANPDPKFCEEVAGAENLDFQDLRITNTVW